MVAGEKKIREKIEDSGKVYERFGLTPMQGRIVAYFTHSDSPEKTFEEIVDFFGASKSSVSNSLNHLLDSGIADYRTYASDRKRYFYLTDRFFTVFFRKVLGNVNELKAHAYRAVSLRSPEHPEASETILKWIGDANLIGGRIEKALSDIQEEKG